MFSYAKKKPAVSGPPVVWIPAASAKPDDDTTVLIADAEGDVSLGFLDGSDGCRYASAERVDTRVMYWAEVPPAPNH